MNADAARQQGGGPGRCPVCRDPVPPGAPAEPFCSDRCRLVDLGRWFSGSYVVSREVTPDDLQDPPPTAPRG